MQKLTHIGGISVVQRLLASLILTLITLEPCLAAIPQITPTVKSNQYTGSAVRIGGIADRELALLNVQWMRATNKPVERLSIHVGEIDGNDLKGAMGYFHVAYREKPHYRLSIDLSRIQRTKLDENKLRQIVKKSQIISKVFYTMDPEDGSTNIALDLKQAITWDAFVQKDKGVLVLDLSEGGAILDRK